MAKARTKCASAGRDCERDAVGKKAKVVLPVAPLPDLIEWWQSEHVPALRSRQSCVSRWLAAAARDLQRRADPMPAAAER